jgi:hypothetical protein
MCGCPPCDRNPSSQSSPRPYPLLPLDHHVRSPHRSYIASSFQRVVMAWHPPGERDACLAADHTVPNLMGLDARQPLLALRH